MATILSLALKVNADASGVVKNLTPAERALENLAKQASKATSVFDEFAKNSEAASAAQATLNEKFAALAEQLKGGLNAQAYADQYAALQDEVRNTADAFAEAAKIIEENRTAEENRAETLARLSELRAIGALSEEQYARAVAESSGANAEAAKAEEDRLRLLERGRQITEQFLTDEERRARQLEELNKIIAANGIAEEAAARARFEFSGLADQLERDGLELRRQLTAEREAGAAKEKVALEQIAAVEKRLAEDSAAAQRLRAQETAKAAAIIAAGRNAQEIFNDAIDEAIDLERKGLLTKKQFDVELERQNAILNKATASADGFGKSVKKAAESGLKFNEISGILALLPGQLGNIAGRFSGISSAAEGLNKVFSGGLKTGLSSLGSQLSTLATPLNLGVAGFAAFGAAATAITRGLAELEGRVEQLGNTALRLGTDFQAIQVLDEAASRSGVSIDALAAGIQALSTNLNEARSGTGKAAEAFRELGISQEQLATLDPATLAKQTADALQGIEDPARRAALATETLGKAGLTLLPGFNAITESEESLRRFSAAISDIDRDRIGSLGQAFDNVKTSLAGLGQSALLPFAGVVDGVARLFADLIGTVTRLAQAIGFVLTPVLDTLGAGFGLLSDGLAAVNGFFDYLVGANQKAAAEVRGLRAEMEDPLEAGFVKEFANDLERINTNLSTAIDESAAFGQAGFDAALRYQESIRELQQQLDDGIINEEVFRRSAEQAGNAFKEELAQIEQDAKLEIQVTENAAKAVAGIRAELSKAIDESAALGQAGFDAALEYQNAVEELQRQFEAGIINEETLSRGAESAQAAYEAQVESVKKLEQEQRKLIENDRERIDTLLAANDDATKLEQDLQAVQREQARVSKELAAARAADNQAQADAAAARQGELDQLQASLEEQQQALRQGFSQGFQAAFDNVNQNIDGLIAKSQQFGQAGSDAALRLQEGIAAAQQQAQAGILDQEAFNAEVQRQQELFNQELANIEKLANERKTINEYVDQQLALQKFGGDQERLAASERVLQIEQEIVRVQEELNKSRDAGNKEEAAAAARRLGELDQVKAKEQDIASGRGKYEEELRKQQQTALQAYQQQQQQAQQAYAQEQARIFEEQRKAAEAEAKRQEERLRKLNTLGQQSISVADVRSVEGANLVLQTAANAQDPALIQARLQTKLLEQVALGISQAASNYFNQPVAIVGAARLN